MRLPVGNRGLNFAGGPAIGVLDCDCFFEFLFIVIFVNRWGGACFVIACDPRLETGG